MSFLQTVRNMRILPTARAIKRLQDAGIVLLSNNTLLRARGRIGAGRKNSKIIRQISTPKMMELFNLNNLSININRINIDNVLEGLQDRSAISRTTWLVEKIKTDKSSKHLGSILKRAGLPRDIIEADIAKELRVSLDGLAEKTVKLSKKKSAKVVEQAAEAFIELANLSKQGDEEFVGFIINVLILASLRHDASLPVHYGAVAFYSAVIAVELGIPVDKDISQWLKTAALLHDIGKIAIPREYHEKKLPSEYELSILREHLPLTIQLLGQIKWLKNVIPIIQHHHDKVGGYPEWLSQDTRQLGSGTRMCVEVLQAADAFDGMTSKRPYKKEGDKYEQIRGGMVYIQKIYRQDEALALLEKWGWDVGVLRGLSQALRNGKEYIYNLKKYFKRDELKLVWFGIEHLIKKTILPFEGRSLDLDKDELILMDHRALLWLISGRKIDHGDANDFVRIVMSELRKRVESNDKLSKQFDRLFALEFDLSLRGLLYILLYRALKVDEKEGSNTFSDLIELSIHLLGDPLVLEGMIRSFKLDNESYSDKKFEWISLKLYGEDAARVPAMGSRSFVKQVNELYGAQDLS
jgi:putative nucleotidyltransferase with HDIG domain